MKFNKKNQYILKLSSLIIHLTTFLFQSGFLYSQYKQINQSTISQLRNVQRKTIQQISK
ncbi:unnamed protein product [Paramecium sonneborni]|uniref:Uncharacterized protein n=1 Tax=Paramecium sonneborni TaxID=65129 RepID=A0A8S1KE22_9CILI|nr:unnamed protein product [Paramecium sonneborni]